VTSEPIEATVRETPDPAEADEWAVVLAAAGIAHRLEATGAGWTLMVQPGDVERARGALSAYDEEVADEIPAGVPDPGYGSTPIGVAVAVLLIGFFVVTGPADGNVVWFARGSAAASRILAGEVWRTVTALTLHVDVAHVLGNALASAVVVTAIGQQLGPGVGIWLLLLAGAGGNMLTALVHGSPHVAVGASTATFGALGILATRSLVMRRHHRRAGRGGWVAVAASLALLGILGTGPRADILAHLLGLLCGATLGLGAALALAPPPGRAVQSALLVAAAALVVGCWGAALAPP